MSDTSACKKCKGKGSHRGGETCAICKGSGRVIVTKDEDGKTVITPAVRT